MIDPGAVCRAFGLGKPVAEWEPVAGGRSHAVRSLVTGRGRFAVKVFDLTVDHASGPGWLGEMAVATRFERAAFAAGLPLPEPIPSVDGGLLADVTGSVVRVHAWVDGGRSLPDEVSDPGTAAAMGALLARVHGLPEALRGAGRAEGLLGTVDDARLAELADRARRAGFAWADAVDAARPSYAAVRALVERRRPAAWPPITAHRDVSPKNVLLRADGSPVLVDWDVAGPWTAVEETASAALEWSGALGGTPDFAAARAFTSAYRRAGGTFAPEGPEVLAGWLVKHANWTEMHLRRALDPELPPPARESASRAAPWLLRQVAREAAAAAEWSERLSG